MKNKKGFIATSLIYSFFLLFVAVLVSILTSTTNDRVQLNRLKQDAKAYINKCSMTKNSSNKYCEH